MAAQGKALPEKQNSSRTGTVYFIECVGHRLVKIGFTDDLDARVKKLQCGCPYQLRLVGSIWFSKPRLERQLHKKFRHLRVRREWFRFEKPIEDYIEANTRKPWVPEMCRGAVDDEPYMRCLDAIESVKRQVLALSQTTEGGTFLPSDEIFAALNAASELFDANTPVWCPECRRKGCDVCNGVGLLKRPDFDELHRKDMEATR
jgi:hypothetical protein